MESFPGYIGAIVIGFIAGAITFSRLAKIGAGDLLRRQRHLNFQDQKLYMSAMARNYAQIIFPRWPDKFVEIEEEVHQFIKSMVEMNIDQLGDILDEIHQRNPLIRDFDKIGLRDFVFYDEGWLSAEFDELVAAYKDCLVYGLFLDSAMILKDVPSAAKRYDTLTADKDERFIKQYAREYKDSLFTHRCLTAMREYLAVDRERSAISRRLHEAGVEFEYDVVFGRNEQPVLYRGEDFEVSSVYHVVERCHGINFLDTGECAVQSVFYDDEKVFVSWERTDDKFESLEGYANQIWTLNTNYITIPFDYHSEKSSPYAR